MATPHPSRPWMPDYPIEADGPLLAWSWAEQRLRTSHEYWLATTRPDGRPHVAPVWAVWIDGALWFSTGPTSRKTRNLAVEPRATMTTNDPTEPVVADGSVERVVDRDRIVGFVPAYEDKYGPSQGLAFFLVNAVFRFEPSVVFGMVEAEFTTSPTRWTY